MIEENFVAYAEIVALTANETVRHLGAMADREIAGGSTYDSMIVRVAEKARVDRIVTLNLDHFLRVSGEGSDRITLP